MRQDVAIIFKCCFLSIRNSKNHPLPWRFSGIYTNAFFLLVIDRKTAYSGLGIVFDGYIGLGGTVPMGGDKTAFVVQYFFKSAVILYTGNHAFSKCQCFLIEVLLDVSQQGFYLICQSVYRGNLFGQKIPSGYFYSIVFQVSRPDSDTNGHTFEFVFVKFPAGFLRIPVVKLNWNLQFLKLVF